MSSGRLFHKVGQVSKGSFPKVFASLGIARELEVEVDERKDLSGQKEH